MSQYWQGTKYTECQVCNRPLGDVFIDGVTRFGPWAVMCTPCHSTDGRGIGRGVGQRYEKQSDHRWLKVA